MTSAHALQLTQLVIENDLDKAGPLLQLLSAFAGSHRIKDEAMTRDVMIFLYSKTDHCETAMKEFISQDDHPLAA